MFIQLVIGSVMISLIVMLHAIVLDGIIRHSRKLEQAALKHWRRDLWKPLVIAAIVLAIFLLHVLEIWIWAVLYYVIEAFRNFESALYFSTTAFTTVGFGDALPAQGWRLLGAIEGANGFMLFGWSTAFTFEILSQLYRNEGGAPRVRQPGTAAPKPLPTPETLREPH